MNFLKARMSDTRNWILVVLILDLLKLSTADAECNCICQNDHSPCDLFETVSHIKTERSFFKNHIWQLKWQKFQLSKLNRKFSDNQDKVEKLEQQLEELKNSSFRTTIPAPLPVEESLINVPEEFNKVSSKNETLQDGDQELASLRATVEGLENKSLEVQKELERERRVRRHIQEDLGNTQAYIRLFDTKLENVTIPVDNRVNQIEEEVISKLENLNKTIVEDYFKKLEYRINDVSYKNETRKLDNRLEEIEQQILDPENSTLISKVKNELKTFSTVLKHLNGSFEKKSIAIDYRIFNTDYEFKKVLGRLPEEIHSLRSDASSLKNDFAEFQSEMEIITEIVRENRKTLISISLEAKSLSNKVSSTFGELDDMKMEFAGLQEKISTAANVATTHKRDLEAPCLLPNITDNNMVVEMEYDYHGTQRLVFRCQPSSQYVFVDPQDPIECKEGIWHGKFPHCSRILDGNEIATILCPQLEPADIPSGVSVIYVSDPEDPPRVIGTQIQYHCNLSNLTFSGNCLETGEWSRDPPSLSECESRKAILCPQLEPADIPSGVSVIYRSNSEGDPRTVGTEIQYNCKWSNLTFSGNCFATGEWSRGPPSLRECEFGEDYEY